MAIHSAVEKSPAGSRVIRACDSRVESRMRLSKVRRADAGCPADSALPFLRPPARPVLAGLLLTGQPDAGGGRGGRAGPGAELPRTRAAARPPLCVPARPCVPGTLG